MGERGEKVCQPVVGVKSDMGFLLGEFGGVV